MFSVFSEVSSLLVVPTKLIKEIQRQFLADAQLKQAFSEQPVQAAPVNLSVSCSVLLNPEQALKILELCHLGQIFTPSPLWITLCLVWACWKDPVKNRLCCVFLHLSACCLYLLLTFLSDHQLEFLQVYFSLKTSSSHSFQALTLCGREKWQISLLTWKDSVRALVYFLLF